jgi:hypothetical protein
MSGTSAPAFCGQITDWKYKLASRAADVFGGETRGDEPRVEPKLLPDPGVHLALELDCLECSLMKAGRHSARRVAGHAGGHVELVAARKVALDSFGHAVNAHWQRPRAAQGGSLPGR